MKIVIYRDKKTNEIKSYHTANKECTEENLNAFNSNINHVAYAEFAELEENSIAYYFYNLKTTTIEQEYSNLRDLQNSIESISNDLDYRLDEIERYIETNKEEHEIEDIKTHDRELVRQVCEKIIIELGSVEDILINLGNGKEDAFQMFCNILKEIQKEYEK